MTAAVPAAQEYMAGHGLAGWLLRDYLDANPIFWNVLGRRVRNVTRPCWLFVPVSGEPTLVAHDVDAGRFSGPDDDDDINSSTEPALHTYSSRASMLEALRSLMPPGGRVAMEYSPDGALPRVGRVDAGSVELVRGLGVEVVGSGDILQYATERWSPEQLESHRFAAERLTRTVSDAFDFIAENINWRLTEHDLAEHIRGRYNRLGLEASDGPVVAIDAHSSDPHYEPEPDGAAVVRRRSWLLVDLWARQKDDPDAIYADITWTAYLGAEPSPEQTRAFDAVRDARDAAVEFIRRAYDSGGPPEGWQVDRAARGVLDDLGYGAHFVHRLGHSLGRTVHSNAVNLDDWETHDTRALIPGLGVTVEPGVYLGDFGVRSEIDLYLTEAGPEITTDPQTEIVLIDV